MTPAPNRDHVGFVTSRLGNIGTIKSILAHTDCLIVFAAQGKPVIRLLSICLCALWATTIGMDLNVEYEHLKITVETR